MVLFCHPDTHYSCIRVRPVSILLNCDPHNSITIQLLYNATRPQFVNSIRHFKWVFFTDGFNGRGRLIASWIETTGDGAGALHPWVSQDIERAIVDHVLNFRVSQYAILVRSWTPTNRMFIWICDELREWSNTTRTLWDRLTVRPPKY
jgi:hypothetical protein